jgi:hypothetical protein
LIKHPDKSRKKILLQFNQKCKFKEELFVTISEVEEREEKNYCNNFRSGISCEKKLLQQFSEVG